MPLNVLRSTLFSSVALPVLLLTQIAHAQVAFTPEEIRQNRLMSAKIAQVGAQCMDSYRDEQVRFFKTWHMSKYYGNRRKDYASKAGRVQAMVRYGIPAATASKIADMQKSTACVTMAMDCLGKGFAAAGMDATWAKIFAHLKINNQFGGTDLQTDLHALGWKSYYWNPDPGSNQAWDSEDRQLNPLAPGRRWMPVWGGHEERYREVLNRGTYYHVPIDDSQTLVGFGKNPPPSFATVPFFIGTAHAGYHVFPGHSGGVVEAHSTREINSIDNIQFSPFNPLASGGPRWTAHEHYRSGVIVVPPGF